MTDELDSGGTASLPGRGARRRGDRRATVVGVLGELFITAGVLVLLFLGWQLWLNDIIVGAEQHDVANGLSQSWSRSEGSGATKPTDPGEPVVAKAPANAKQFAVLMVPRWGKDYKRPVAEGIGVADVLNQLGIGHYPGTQMPGDVGNFAIASHRMANGGGFKNLHQLRVGDPIFVETKDGWYKYIFRNIEYVQPTRVDVVASVPTKPNAEPKDRFITMTTCNPFFSTAERLVAYGLFDTWYPRKGGPPPELAKRSGN